MNIGKKIKLYSLLIIAPMSTVAQANLGTWMQEKALRGFAYLYNFLPMENNFDKKGVLCIASGTLVLTGLVSYLKAKAQSKEEKERLDEKFKYERKVANVIDSSAALVMPYIGFRLYRGMIQAENFTKDLVAPYKTDSVVYTNNRFISAQQDIMSIIAAIDIHKPKILVQPAKGNMRSSCFSGTPQGCYIEIGAEFDPHNQEHRFVLGHEAAHVKNNHHKKRAIAAFLIPAGVHTGCALLHWGAKK